MDKYTYRIIWSEKDNEYIGLCTEFPSLSWLATTQVEALEGIIKVVSSAIQDMKKNNEVLPMSLSTRRFSGKFTVRIPPEIHRKVRIEADEANISLNRLVSAKLSR